MALSKDRWGGHGDVKRKGQPHVPSPGHRLPSTDHRPIESAHIGAQKQKKQHPTFASGHPRHYYLSPNVLIFSKRDGIRRSTLVWPFLQDEEEHLFIKGGKPGKGATHPCHLRSHLSTLDTPTNNHSTPNQSPLQAQLGRLRPPTSLESIQIDRRRPSHMHQCPTGTRSTVRTYRTPDISSFG